MPTTKVARAGAVALYEPFKAKMIRSAPVEKEVSTGGFWVSKSAGKSITPNDILTSKPIGSSRIDFTISVKSI